MFSLQLHAEYSRDKDSYLPHRVVQAWELQQFIRYCFSLFTLHVCFTGSSSICLQPHICILPFLRAYLLFVALHNILRDFKVQQVQEVNLSVLTYSCLPISHTSVGADVVILGGDLNMHPQDLGCRLLRTATGLRDSYVETPKFEVGTNKNAAYYISVLKTVSLVLFFQFDSNLVSFV